MQIKRISFLVVLLACYLSSVAQIRMEKRDNGILLTEDDENVLFYQINPKSKNGEYERCNYIHPLWGLNGKELTEDFPADHLHHRGIFWTWHQVWIGDKRIGDPWMIDNSKQDVVEFEFVKHPSGEVIIKTEVDWLSGLWKKAGKEVPYLKEYGKVKINPRSGNYRKIDFEIKLLAQEKGLKIGGSEDEKGYGGFSVRMALPDDVKFSGKNGNVEPEVTAVESPGFINISGNIDAYNKKGGIVIVDHPDNPGFPHPWILRSKSSMQNAAWPGKNPVEISTSKPLVLKYSLIVYSGKMSQKKINKIFKE